MKNILLIIQKLSNGGAEKAITNLANTLKDDYNVTMVVFDNSVKEYIPNIKVIDLKTPINMKFYKKMCLFFYRIIKVKRIKKELNIDCTISFLTGPNLVNCLTRTNDKIIISIRNMQSKLKLNFFKRLANQISLKKAHKVITVSKMVEEDIKKNYKVDEKRIITIYNMVDSEMIYEKMQEEIEEIELFNKKAEQLDDKNGIIIVSIGRLILQKGQWHLIKAFKLVTKQYKDAKLIILGRGPLKNDFQKLIHRLDLDNNVFLLDFKTNPYKYLANSDLFISTSLYEGMPNVILEAMACSLPIIATDCEGGTKEILSPNSDIYKSIDKTTDSEYGILVPKMSYEYDISESITSEEENLAKAIIDLISDEKKTKNYVQMSKERIKKFENKTIKKKWIKVIEE
ncbi:MAG: glycosyltransferase [Clostridia bacterium]|nr:glycosyltransferase [Clostridia bacterium]